MVTRIRKYLELKGWIKHQPPFRIPFRSQIILAMKRPVNLEKIQLSIQQKTRNLDHRQISRMNEAIDYLIKKKRRKDASNLFVAALRAFVKMKRELGVNFAIDRIYQIPDSRAVKSLVNRLVIDMQYDEIPKLLKLVGPSPWKVSVNSKLAKLGERSKPKSSDNQITGSMLQSFTELFKPSENPPIIDLVDKSLSEIKIACVLDNFSFSAFNLEAKFKQLSVENYLQELHKFKPDIIFFESAWRGKDGLWGSKVGHADYEVIDILKWAKKYDCPTVFWNKEDPVHFKSFLNVAKLFNYVFTTDIDCIQRYKKALQHDRVYLLPFAVQPTLHNPVEEFDRIDKMCFAGAYYRKYAERNEDMENILSVVGNELGYDIYDRNYLDDHPDYKFPEKFHKNIIGTLDFSEINLAYKGYACALNLNTIKNSQTMFARRVFELLASNTLVVSNYSRGIRTLFGDIVLSSDSGDEILQRYMLTSEEERQQVKLLGIRKVFSEHTYEDRLRYVVNKVSINFNQAQRRCVLAVSLVKDKIEAQNVIDNFYKQVFAYKKLIIITEEHFDIELQPGLEVIHQSDLDQHFFEEFGDSFDNVCYIHHECKYGRNYLTDVVNGSKFSGGLPVSKLCKNPEDKNKLTPFTRVSKISAISSLFPMRSIMNKPVLPNLRRWRNYGQTEIEAILLDSFEIGTETQPLEELSPKINIGKAYSQILAQSELIAPDRESAIGNYFSSAEIYQQICDANRDKVEIEFTDGKTVITSNLGDGEFTYLYWHDFMKPKDIDIDVSIGNIYLDSTPGLRMMIAVIYYDKDRKKLGSDMSLANSNLDLKMPKGTVELRLAFRVYQQGISEINSLDLFTHNITPQTIFTNNKVLVVSNNYPSYKEKYRNGFLHSRVINYKREGLEVDVFVLRDGHETIFREYEGISVIQGSRQALENILHGGNHDKILVHFLDSSMWKVLSKYSEERSIIVWIHGSEIQPWHRRKFNYLSKEDEEKAKVASIPRMKFWRELFGNIPDKMKFIFVSQYFADEVMEDVGLKLNESKYKIVHNPIDTMMFNYVEKTIEHRKRILSIRPFASMKYANDLTVKAILELSKSKYFNEFEIMIVGDGRLFDETLEPLQKFSNVTIKRGFLSHKEISSLHKEYGIFVTPTRMDSQGVSRDEAMSSGLVPVTTEITAIPEFVDNNCGVLTPPEDYKSISAGILELYDNPERFLEMSENASNRVRNQTDSKLIIEAELRIIDGD